MKPKLHLQPIVRAKRSRLIERLETRTLLSNTWYVSTTGSNSNPGTLAAPFQTIQFAANKANAGDTVDILGGVYHETVTLHESGTATAPITFQPYNNQTVTVDGADPITNWTLSHGDVWTASMPENLGEGNNQVFVDGQMMNEARWPNTTLDVSHPTVAKITSAIDSTNMATIYNSSMNQPAGFWVGGYIDFGPGQDWVRQTGTITASGPGWVTFTYTELNTTYEAPHSGNQFFLFGAPGALDSASEWARSNGKLSLWTPTGDSPANHVVEAKSRTYGFDLSSASNIDITGINLFACTINTTSKSNNIVINGITDEYLSQFMVFANGWHPPKNTGFILAGTNDVLENSLIAYSAGDGVVVAGTGGTIQNNIIHDIDYMGVDAAPIHITGSSNTITGNTLFNAGRDGIFYSGGSKNIVTYNLVHDFGLQDTDLGGFYSFGISGGGTVVAYNEFYNGVTGGYGGSGIMFDNNSSNFIVDHNVVTNVNIALRINEDGQGLIIINNTFDATQWSVGVLDHDDWTGAIIANNVFTMPIMRFGEFSVVTNNVMDTNLNDFVNAALDNFALKAGDPELNAGIVEAPYTNGYTGKPPDAGYMEFGVTPFAVGANLTMTISTSTFKKK